MPYTGSSVNNKIRMDLINRNNGLLIQDILEIGKIIKNQDSEYKSMEIKINMKVVGREIRETDKELIGCMRAKIN